MERRQTRSINNMEDIHKKLTAGINWIVKNWSKIPDNLKREIEDSNKSKVILLLNRQKPSIEQCCDFNEERISVNEKGQIIWGFDSGCSCPSPWYESAPDCYSCSDSIKDFILNDFSGFDEGALEECLSVIEEIKDGIQKVRKDS